MQIRNTNKKSKRRVILELIIVALVTLAIVWWNPVPTFNQQAQDRMFQRTGVASADIQVIGIDDATLEEYGTATTTWAREKVALLIAKLNENPDTRPCVIGVDIMFFTEGNKANDDLLARVCEESGNVIVAAQAKYEKKVVSNAGGYALDADYISDISFPYDSLKNVVPSAIVNTKLDDDGQVRKAIYSVERDGKVYDSLGVAIAKRYAEANGIQITPPQLIDQGLDEASLVSKETTDFINSKSFDIRYTAKSGTYYSGNSFIKVLDGSIPSSRFAGDIVLIGAFASGMMDSYLTPIDLTVPMNGVEVHANIADSLISGRQYTEIPWGMQLALTLVIVVMMAYVLRKVSYTFATIIMVAFAGLFTLACLFAAKDGLVFAPLYPAVLVALCYIEALAENYYFEQKRKKEIMGTFKQYVAPSVVDDILREHSEENTLMGCKRDVAVMFTDIRGFTSMSERLTPEQVAEVLNEYFSLITDVTFRNGGTIDKFIGDGCMVLFNAPLDQPDYKMDAIRTGLEIVDNSKELTTKFADAYGIDVRIGIGINCGSAVVGNIGTDFRRDYTAIGDTVNTASRLEGLAKPGQVIITESLREELGDKITAETIGLVSIKGKTEAIKCYNITGTSTAK